MLVPLFVPVISDVIATVPLLFGKVYVLSADNVPANKVPSFASAALPSNTTPFVVDTTSTLFVVVVPVTTKSPGIVIVSVESPIDTAFEPNPPAKAVFKFAIETSSFVFVSVEDIVIWPSSFLVTEVAPPPLSCIKSSVPLLASNFMYGSVLPPSN